MAHKLDFRGIHPYFGMYWFPVWGEQTFVHVARRTMSYNMLQGDWTRVAKLYSKCLYPPNHLTLSVLIFEMDVGASNSGPYSCTGSISLTQQSPWPPSIFLSDRALLYSPAWNSLHSPSWLQICGSLGLNLPCAGITGVGFHAWFPSNHFCDTGNETQGLSQAKQHTLPLTSPALLKLSFSLSKNGKGDVRLMFLPHSGRWNSTCQQHASWSSSLKWNRQENSYTPPKFFQDLFTALKPQVLSFI